MTPEEITERHRELGAEIEHALRSVDDDVDEEEWDGEPPTRQYVEAAARHARSLGNALVTFAPTPVVFVDPDGDIAFRWYVDNDMRLVVSVSPEGRVAYAAMLRCSRQRGTEPWPDDAVPWLSMILRRLYPPYKD